MLKRGKYFEIWQPIKSKTCDNDVRCRVCTYIVYGGFSQTFRPNSPRSKKSKFAPTITMSTSNPSICFLMAKCIFFLLFQIHYEFR